jgi:hypothetical protein
MKTDWNPWSIALFQSPYIQIKAAMLFRPDWRCDN